MPDILLPNGGGKNNEGEFDYKARTTQEAINATVTSRALYAVGQKFYDTSRSAWFECIGSPVTAWTFKMSPKRDEITKLTSYKDGFPVIWNVGIVSSVDGSIDASKTGNAYATFDCSKLVTVNYWGYVFGSAYGYALKKDGVVIESGKPDTHYAINTINVAIADEFLITYLNSDANKEVFESYISVTGSADFAINEINEDLAGINARTEKLALSDEPEIITLSAPERVSTGGTTFPFVTYKNTPYKITIEGTWEGQNIGLYFFNGETLVLSIPNISENSVLERTLTADCDGLRVTDNIDSDINITIEKVNTATNFDSRIIANALANVQSVNNKLSIDTLTVPLEKASKFVWNIGIVSSTNGSIDASKTGNQYFTFDCSQAVSINYWGYVFGSSYGYALKKDGVVIESGKPNTHYAINTIDVSNADEFLVTYLLGDPNAADFEIKFEAFGLNLDDTNSKLNHSILRTDTQNYKMFVPIMESTGGVNYPLALNKGVAYEFYLEGIVSHTVGLYLRDADNNTVAAGGSRADDSKFTLTPSAEVAFVRVTDNIDSNIVVNIRRLVSVESIKQEVDILNSVGRSEKLNNLDSHISLYKNTAFANGLKMEKEIEDNLLIILKDSIDHSAHDSTIVIKSGIAYVIYMANTSETGGDNAGTETCVVHLAKFTLSNPADVVYYTVSEKDGIYNGITVNGGSGSPNMIEDQNDADIIRLIWSAEISAGYFAQLTCEYKISTNVFQNYAVVNATNGTVSGVLNSAWINSVYGTGFGAADFNNMQANSSIGFYNNEYYLGLCWGYGNGGTIIFKTADFVNWTFVTDHLDLNLDFVPVFETACFVNATGYLYIAIRPMYPTQNTGSGTLSTSNTYGTLIKYNLTTSLKVDETKILNCSSRPNFWEFNSKLYLMSNPYWRTIGDIIEVNELDLKSSLTVQQVSEHIMNYLSVFPYSGVNYMANTALGGIAITSFSIETITKATVKEAFKTFFEL